MRQPGPTVGLIFHGLSPMCAAVSALVSSAVHTVPLGFQAVRSLPPVASSLTTRRPDCHAPPARPPRRDSPLSPATWYLSNGGHDVRSVRVAEPLDVDGQRTASIHAIPSPTPADAATTAAGVTTGAPSTVHAQE